MRILITQKAKSVYGVCITVVFFLFLLLNILGYFLDLQYISVFAATARADKFQVRSELLMLAMGEVGVCGPEDAAAVWSKGLMQRSGALQYAVMTDALREKYVPQLEQYNPNWVTGMSSPWVERFKILKTDSPNPDTRVFEMQYTTATSTGDFDTYNAVLTVVREGAFWRISALSMEEGLYPYTGFIP